MKANRIISLREWLLLFVALVPATGWAANAVNVTIEAEKTALVVGESTTVTVYGQIDAAIAATSDQIFSWYVDVLNNAGGVVSGYASVQTPASDNASTSHDGVAAGANLRGIYDTFLDRPAAGKGSRVVLVQFDVTAQAAGTATLNVAAGTTVGPLTDFLVSKTGGGSYIGGNYTGASLAISVAAGPDLSGVNLRVTMLGNVATATFNPIAGFNHTVQVSTTHQAASWVDLPGAPHNSGMVSQNVTLTGVSKRFYRVCVALP
jgi:hypothetical protein